MPRTCEASSKRGPWTWWKQNGVTFAPCLRWNLFRISSKPLCSPCFLASEYHPFRPLPEVKRFSYQLWKGQNSNPNHQESGGCRQLWGNGIPFAQSSLQPMLSWWFCVGMLIFSKLVAKTFHLRQGPEWVLFWCKKAGAAEGVGAEFGKVGTFFWSSKVARAPRSWPSAVASLAPECSQGLWAFTLCVGIRLVGLSLSL